ncbi:hypothetical protein HO133_003128 [Letharia lupina]|uniref:Uncharacterized protein n=1 Tax=Letharia lupina TaxID=560253 RepID=A0A8H6CBV0_9LECA|nr:uncharacterized protein HO133_003128 [Letharia lupina]KAF6220695.1 hypothetical protein HO133_003128 [Letharia lupina]
MSAIYISSGSSVSSSDGPGSSLGWLQSSASSPSGSSLSLSTKGLTTASSASISFASPAVSSSSAPFPQWSPPEVHAAFNGSSNSSGFPKFNVDQKEKNVPGITASASYSASGAFSSAIPASITSMRNPFNVTKPLNQTNVCGGPVSIASSLITSGLFPANDCLPLNWDQGVLDMPYGGNCSMSPGFDGYNAKSCSCVNSAAKWYHDYATATVTSQQCQSSYDLYEALDIQTLGCSYNTITELATPYPAPTSCCDKCEVAASAVQLVYWPPADAPSNSSSGTNTTGSSNWNVTAAPVQSAASYGIVENGFTFISPSVYVIYSSIQASASCVALFNSHIPIGSAYTAVTRAYDPNGLSTAICEAENMGAGIEYCISPVADQNNPAYCFQGIDNGWRQIDFSELYDPPPASDLLTRYQSCFPGHSISADFASMMFVKPQLAFPPDVTDIDPVWATWGGSTCTPVNLGVYDPPRVLQKATALAPVPTPAADPQAEKAPPSPAATLKSPVAAPTTAATSAEPNNGVKANDPGSNNAGTATPTTAQSDPVAAVVDPVDPSVVAQNEGSPATGNSNVVKAGSNSKSNSDPVAAVVDPVNGSVGEQNESPPNTANSGAVNAGLSSDPNSDPSSGNSNSDPGASGGGTTPVDTEKQSGANAATNPGTDPSTDSATGNNDPSTAPITLLPQQPVDTAKENGGTSATSGKTGNAVGGANGGSKGGNSGITNGGTSGGTSGGTTGTKEDTSGGTDSGSNGGINDGTSGSPNGDGNTNPAPIASVNSQPITKDTSGNILLSGSTLAPGSTAIFSGHTIANAPSAVIMDGSTYAPSPTTPSAPSLLVNNQLLQLTNGGLKIGSRTLVPGTHTTMDDHVIDYANPSQVIEDGVTHNLAPVSSSNPLVLSGQTLSRATDGGLITAGTTIAPGSAAAIGGHVYSLAGSSSLIMDGNTYALPAATDAYQIQAATSSPPPIVAPGPLTLANGLVVTAQPSTSPDTPQNYLLPNGASLSADGSAAVYSGTTYSALPSNAGIVAADPSGSSTLAIPTVPPPATPSIHTAAGATFTPQPSGFAIGGTTLTPGGRALTTSGTIVSLGTGGTFVLASSPTVLPPQSVFAAAGAAFTAHATGFVLGAKSFTPGGAAYTIDGTVVSLGTDSVLSLGGTAYRLGPQSVFTLAGHTSTAAATGLGGAVASGLRGVGFQGAAAARGADAWGAGLGLGVAVAAVVL